MNLEQIESKFGGLAFVEKPANLITPNESNELLMDTHGHLIIKHDLLNHDGLTQDSIAEAFIEFAKKENLSFFDCGLSGFKNLTGLYAKAFDAVNYRVLLERLEAVEIIYLKIYKSVIDFRIDANTYKKEYLKTEILLNQHQNLKIEDISISVQNFVAYSLCNLIEFKDEGIPFLMTKNIRENYIDWNVEKYVTQETHEMLWKSHCQRGQVLVTMAGEHLGRVAVYDRDEIVSSNQAIAKITLKKGINPYFLATFLNSRHGQNQIQRFKTITGQPNINMALIKSLKVPIVQEKFESEIEKIVYHSELIKEKSSSTYTQAETLLFNALNMVDFSPSTENVNIKSFKDSFAITGRLDAEYYQPKYENHILSYTNNWGSLIDSCNLKDSNYYPEDNTIYKYIELANIDKSGGITNCTTELGKELPSRARRKVQSGDVLISSIEGSLSS
ncbi:MAG: restriction endonuclease subunit S [Methylococcaceae bacterium]